eukprot:CAMPEP_0195047802 /NCGR_PEP_ID=MMETSP0347-20130606/40462_1 /TAXON_ID=2932 /ORGANISM="Alexandrium fundyense, Strain CCMP1719" /LENGTH=58 /DNA_ID=CAMNT_0040076127 /DNA_START=34 /DNA_END=210 /DNA_ORIENTATION=-
MSLREASACLGDASAHEPNQLRLQCVLASVKCAMVVVRSACRPILLLAVVDDLSNDLA